MFARYNNSASFGNDSNNTGMPLLDATGMPPTIDSDVPHTTVNISERLAFIIVNMLVDVFATAFNIITLVVYWQFKELQRKANVSIFAMALAALVLTASHLGVTILGTIGEDMSIDKVWCSAEGFVEMVLGYFVVQTVALTSMQRQSIVSKITRPNSHQKLWKAKIKGIITIVWVSCLSIPLVTCFQTQHIDTTIYHKCYNNNHYRNLTSTFSVSQLYQMAHLVVLFVIPSFVILCNYVYIYIVVKKKSTITHKGLQRNRPAVPTRLCCGIMVMLVAYILTMLPKNLFIFTENTRLLRVPRLALFTTNLLSNVFLQFSSLLHMFTSTRFKIKLMKFLRSRTSNQTQQLTPYRQRNEISLDERRQTRVLGLERNSRAYTCSAVASERCRSYLQHHPMPKAASNCRETEMNASALRRISLRGDEGEKFGCNKQAIPVGERNMTCPQLASVNSGKSNSPILRNRMAIRRFTETDVTFLKTAKGINNNSCQSDQILTNKNILPLLQCPKYITSSCPSNINFSFQIEQDVKEPISILPLISKARIMVNESKNVFLKQQSKLG
eukprot:gene12229-13489_t